MAPTWLTVIAWVYIGICFICAGVIAYDIVIAGRRQPMAVMNWVFPITALYFGPFALALYWRWARVSAHRRRPHVERSRPGRASMAIEVSHCGSGCTVGDLIAEWVIYALGLAIAGRVLFAEYVGDYVLAVAFGIVFQYFAIAPMRGLGVRDGLTGGHEGRLHLADVLRDRPVRMDGADGVRVLPGAQQSDAQLDRVYR